MTIFTIAEDVLDLFSDVEIGAVWGTLIGPKPNVQDQILRMRKAAEEKLSALGLQTEKLTNYPPVGSWRAAYQRFGAKPKKHKPTHEALVRRLLKDEGWPDIHTLVDVYLTNQAFHVIPHGGYDLDTLDGDFTLRISPGGETFTAIGGDIETTEPGEVVYGDKSRVLTRRWNYKDSDFTKLTPDTRHFALFLESPSQEIPADAVEAATSDLKGRIEAVFDCHLQSAIVNRENPSLEL